MTPPRPTPPAPSPGAVVVDLDGTVVGRVHAVHVDPNTDVAVWVTVVVAATGSGSGSGSETVVAVPLAGAVPDAGAVRVAWPAAQVRAAPPTPEAAASGVLTGDELAAATQHYQDPAAPPPDLNAQSAERPRTTGVMSGGGGSSGDGVEVVRSEERLHLRTEAHPVQRLRIRKHIVTTEHTITVQLRHEELRLDYEPVTPSAATPTPDVGARSAQLDAAGGGGWAGEGPVDDAEGVVVDMVLHAERPVITTEVVPVERVQVRKHLVTENQDVAAQLRREVVDQDHDTPAGA